MVAQPNNVQVEPPQRKPKLKNVPSRYLSPSPTTIPSSSTKRYPSPSPQPIKPPSLLPNRSHSVDRRRPPTHLTEMSSATKTLVTSSRSLSVSFQGEAFSLPISKKKETTVTPRRRTTPVPDQRENSTPVTDQQLWPGAASRRVISESVSNSVRSRVLESDSDSVSSGSSSEVSRTRNIKDSAKFWQETNTRLRRLQDPASSKRFSNDSLLASSSPIRGRPASPSKVWGSTAARGGSSPCRGRNGVAEQMNAYKGTLPSILCFAADIRRGKIGEGSVMDAHLLRLLYNRDLQWRFANARAEYTLMVQRMSAERKLWNAWVLISELRHSVTLKRIKLLLVRQKLKLASILKGQMRYLEKWALLDRDHSNSLSGATEALKASTFRLPIIGKAVVDIEDLNHAVSSALGVMHAIMHTMASSIYSLTSQVEEMNSVMAEMVNITTKEKVLLGQCQGFLSRVAAMQVTDCSMRTHIIQLSRDNEQT